MKLKPCAILAALFVMPVTASGTVTYSRVSVQTAMPAFVQRNPAASGNLAAGVTNREQTKEAATDAAQPSGWHRAPGPPLSNPLPPQDLAGVPGSPGSTAPTPALPSADLAGWHVYRNDRYAFELRYPPDYVIVSPRLEIQPAPLFRVWFQEASLANSPIAEYELPRFTVDIYDNASQQPLDTWLTTSGVTRNLVRVAREPAEVGGIQGVRLESQVMLAPGTFYFVARGPFVYRFTPFGRFSGQVLATVCFTP
jgi:hypothetical protein